jgi:replicative DNA helicase
MDYPDEPDFNAPVAPEPEPREVRQARPNLAQKASYLPDTHRLLPQAPDAEKGVLCSLLLMPRDVAEQCEEKGITPEAFHLPNHATIYRTAIRMIEEKKPLDFITLTAELKDRNELDQCGGAAYITGLFTFLPTAANADYYIQILADKWKFRRAIQVGTEFAARSYDEQDNADGLIEEFERAVLSIRQGDTGEIREEDPQEAVMRAIAAIEATYEARGTVNGQTTGFPQLDEMIDGLKPGEMTVIAARPSMGKTALAINIAEHIALDTKRHVAFFTLEMSTDQIMQRLLCSRAKVNMASVRKGFLSDRDFPALTGTATHVANLSTFRPLEMISPTVTTIAARARRLNRRYPLAAIVVDYLQLCRSNSKQAKSNREREIAEVSAGLKNLAKELKLPVVVLAQLNRDAEKRTGAKGRPRMSDLRESGSIEQDADVIGLLHREDYYAETDDEKRECEGKATLIIAKNRNGPTGDIPLTFLKEFARYESRARAEQDEPTTEQKEDPRKPKNQPDLV